MSESTGPFYGYGQLPANYVREDAGGLDSIYNTRGTVAAPSSAPAKNELASATATELGRWYKNGLEGKTPAITAEQARAALKAQGETDLVIENLLAEWDGATLESTGTGKALKVKPDPTFDALQAQFGDRLRPNTDPLTGEISKDTFQLYDPATRTLQTYTWNQTEERFKPVGQAKPSQVTVGRSPIEQLMLGGTSKTTGIPTGGETGMDLMPRQIGTGPNLDPWGRDSDYLPIYEVGSSRPQVPLDGSAPEPMADFLRDRIPSSGGLALTELSPRGANFSGFGDPGTSVGYGMGFDAIAQQLPRGVLSEDPVERMREIMAYANFLQSSQQAGFTDAAIQAQLFGPGGTFSGPRTPVNDMQSLYGMGASAYDGAPVFAANGAELMLDEPAMLVGMNSGRPYAVAGEAGKQEHVKFTPTGTPQGSAAPMMPRTKAVLQKLVDSRMGGSMPDRFNRLPLPAIGQAIEQNRWSQVAAKTGMPMSTVLRAAANSAKAPMPQMPGFATGGTVTATPRMSDLRKDPRHSLGYPGGTPNPRHTLFPTKGKYEPHFRDSRMNDSGGGWVRRPSYSQKINWQELAARKAAFLERLPEDIPGAPALSYWF